MRILPCLLAVCLLAPHILPAQTDLEKLNVKGKPKTIVTREYNAKDEFGKPAKTDMERRITAKFNEAGYMTEETVAKENGTVVIKRVSECDASGKATAQGTYSASGNLMQKSVYQYDASGKVIIEMVYDDKGAAKTKIESKYDAKGNKTEENSYYLTSDKKAPATDKSTYNEAGKAIERIFTSPYVPDQQGKATCAYNENGDMVALKSIGIKTTTQEIIRSTSYTYVYQYDAQKNWISQTILEGEAKIVKRIIEREYTY